MLHARNDPQVVAGGAPCFDCSWAWSPSYGPRHLSGVLRKPLPGPGMQPVITFPAMERQCQRRCPVPNGPHPALDTASLPQERRSGSLVQRTPRGPTFASVLARVRGHVEASIVLRNIVAPVWGAAALRTPAFRELVPRRDRRFTARRCPLRSLLAHGRPPWLPSSIY